MPDGDDYLIVNGTAANQFYMGEGADYVDLNGVGQSEVWGEGGADTIKGSEGADKIYGGEGDDVLYTDKGDGDWVNAAAFAPERNRAMSKAGSFAFTAASPVSSTP